MVPMFFNAVGSSHAWLKNCTPAYRPVRSSCVISSRCSIATSLIGWCVPRAIMTSSALVAPPTCSWIALNIVPTGAVRVASGMMSSTLRSRNSSSGIALATTSTACPVVSSLPSETFLEITPTVLQIVWLRNPPSTTMSEPVTKLAAFSLAR